MPETSVARVLIVVSFTSLNKCSTPVHKQFDQQTCQKRITYFFGRGVKRGMVGLFIYIPISSTS